MGPGMSAGGAKVVTYPHRGQKRLRAGSCTVVVKMAGDDAALRGLPDPLDPPLAAGRSNASQGPEARERGGAASVSRRQARPALIAGAGWLSHTRSGVRFRSAAGVLGLTGTRRAGVVLPFRANPTSALEFETGKLIHRLEEGLLAHDARYRHAPLCDMPRPSSGVPESVRIGRENSAILTDRVVQSRLG